MSRQTRAGLRKLVNQCQHVEAVLKLMQEMCVWVKPEASYGEGSWLRIRCKTCKVTVSYVDKLP